MSRRPRLTAAEIAHALGGRRSGLSYVARCPAHDDHKPSLSIADGADSKILVHCHAGCTQDEVIAALRMRGLWPTAVFGAPSGRPIQSRVNLPNVDEDFARRHEHAMMLWKQVHPIAGSAAETYLRSRGISIEAPPSLRFQEKLKHGPQRRAWAARGRQRGGPWSNKGGHIRTHRLP